MILISTIGHIVDTHIECIMDARWSITISLWSGPSASGRGITHYTNYRVLLMNLCSIHCRGADDVCERWRGGPTIVRAFDTRGVRGRGDCVTNELLVISTLSSVNFFEYVMHLKTLPLCDYLFRIHSALWSGTQDAYFNIQINTAEAVVSLVAVNT